MKDGEVIDLEAPLSEDPFAFVAMAMRLLPENPAETKLRHLLLLADTHAAFQRRVHELGDADLDPVEAFEQHDRLSAAYEGLSRYTAQAAEVHEVSVEQLAELNDAFRRPGGINNTAAADE